MNELAGVLFLLRITVETHVVFLERRNEMVLYAMSRLLARFLVHGRSSRSTCSENPSGRRMEGGKTGTWRGVTLRKLRRWEEEVEGWMSQERNVCELCELLLFPRSAPVDAVCRLRLVGQLVSFARQW